MKVFISWSGQRSKGVAIALREWLPLVLHYVEPWLSEADIEAGERWAQSVAKELATSNFGIICVTSENIGSPWVLFEAGALTKSLESSRVIPLLLDLDFTDITGPLAQFQAKKLVREGVEEVIRSVNTATDEHIPDERAAQLFDALWTELEKKLAGIPEQAPTERHMRPQHEILEELVASVRALDSRMGDIEEIAAGGKGPRRSRRRMHPMMLREFSHMGEKANDPIAILFVASMFRDDMPWVYEMGAETYRSIKSGAPDAANALRNFRRIAEFTMHGPFPPDEFGVDPRMLDMAMHELERVSEHFTSPDKLDEEGKDEGDA